jgi:hypothetical protein
MTDKSTYTVEERTTGTTRVHGRPHTGKTMSDTRNDSVVIFNKAAPPKMTILCWEKKLSQTGSIKDMLWSGRLST